jgi:chromosome segregation ATPase
MRSSFQSACDILCAYLDTLAGEPVQRSWIKFYLDVDLTDLETLQSANNMTDYFSEYSSFVGAKGLPSPADTPYETPGFLRSKRSSRATTAGSSRSREQSASPPPLPPDATEYAEKSREGRYSALDPRRFTPTLHASLVSEILSLRRELDSKNNLVENLETSLASAKTDNETLSQELTTNAKEVRNARQQMAQMESGAYEALETMVKERDGAIASLEELKGRLEVSQKKTRGQDEDAERTQSIWEREKEQWDNERD